VTLIIYYDNGNGWAWRSSGAGSFIDDELACIYLDTVARDGRVITAHRNALAQELFDLGLDPGAAVLSMGVGKKIALNLELCKHNSYITKPNPGMGDNDLYPFCRSCDRFVEL